MPGFTYSRWYPKWLQDYFMSDSMFQPFNYLIVKTGIFDKNVVEKSHKDIYITQNTIQEVQNIPFQKKVKGQMSVNFRKSVQFIALVISQ